MKREREEEEGAEEPQNGKQVKLEPKEEKNDSDDEYIVRRSRKAEARTDCPYLDTVSRQNLDFDFEKCCSVSLSPVNVYACLVCGKYFQGRGLHTFAYTHALESGHHMFMKLEDGRVFCLPDGYEVVDRSLDVIKYNRDPTFTAAERERLDKDVTWARALDGAEYMPGLLGLNNMKHNDYANVVVQIFSRVGPIRDFFLEPSNYRDCRSLLVRRFGELLRKIWNPRNFRGQVSPHEFMQAVMQASKKRFTIEARSDPVEFFTWLLNTLHSDLTGGKRKVASIITRCFQGEMEVVTEAGTGRATSGRDTVERAPFLMLGLDLPPAPLYKDASKKNIIPQVPIFDLLRKFDGRSIHDDIRNGRRRYRITRLPLFLVLHVKRFSKNNFFLEKNPTIVNFPVKNLELRDIVPVPSGKSGAQSASKYDLIANVVQDGEAANGTFRAHVHRKVEDTWYEVENLRVLDTLPQVVALSEAYLQVYELKRTT